LSAAESSRTHDLLPERGCGKAQPQHVIESDDILVFASGTLYGRLLRHHRDPVLAQVGAFRRLGRLINRSKVA